MSLLHLSSAVPSAFICVTRGKLIYFCHYFRTLFVRVPSVCLHFIISSSSCCLYHRIFTLYPHIYFKCLFIIHPDGVTSFPVFLYIYFFIFISRDFFYIVSFPTRLFAFILYCLFLIAQLLIYVSFPLNIQFLDPCPSLLHLLSIVFLCESHYPARLAPLRTLRSININDPI